jgi:hypothetical protein
MLTLEIASNDASENGNRYSRGENQGRSRSHISNAPQKMLKLHGQGQEDTLSCNERVPPHSTIEPDRINQKWLSGE